MSYDYAAHQRKWRRANKNYKRDWMRRKRAGLETKPRYARSWRAIKTITILGVRCRLGNLTRGVTHGTAESSTK